MGIIFATIGHLLIGISLVADRILIKQRQQGRALTYVFWIGLLNIFGAPFIFFAPLPATLTHIGTALLAGFAYFGALYFYYRALHQGEASQAVALVGGFEPIATLLIAFLLLGGGLNIAEYVAFGFLVVGGFVMFVSDRISLRESLLSILTAAALFGLGNVLERLTLLHLPFATGFGFTKLGTALAAALILLIPYVRRQVATRSRAEPQRRKVQYFANRILAAGGSLLIFYSFSLSHPAIVSAISGVRYVAVFVGVFLLAKLAPRILKERFSRWAFWGKALATVIILIGLLGLGLQSFYEQKPVPAKDEITWGVTFSQLMAEQLRLDTQETYRAVLTELQPQKVRLVAYWDRIETNDDEFNFEELDWLMDASAEADAQATLVVGQKVPRWPECHYPHFVREIRNSNTEIRNQKTKEQLFEYLRVVVGRYKNHPALESWQVENEPFLPFGECPHELVRELLDEELALVRSLDPETPITMTASGEIDPWVGAARRGDRFGTTLYRKVHNDIFGFITYPITPEFYPLKQDIVEWFLGHPLPNPVVIELGLEPWGKLQIQEMTYDEQMALFNFDDFNENISFAERTGFDTHYMWGVEWWYWLRETRGDDRFWRAAQELIK